MEKDIIKRIIIEKQRELPSIKLIRRDVQYDNANYVLVGPRRAGKSYLIYQYVQTLLEQQKISADNILYINFEDERITSIRAEELGLILEAYWELYPGLQPLICMDEIQNIVGWEKFARRLADTQYRVMITGSNAKMLSAEIATTLGGRYIPRDVYPFSFNEYLAYLHIDLDTNWQYDEKVLLSIRRAFDTYLRYGGFADVFDKTDKREWLSALYQKIIMGDIVERYSIRNARVFRLLARKLSESVLQPMTLRRLHHIVESTGDKLSMPILKDYLQYMEEAYLTFVVPNITASLSEQATACKRYFTDNGVLNLFNFDDVSKLLENIVAIQLQRRYPNTNTEYRVFFYNKNIEVDFCVPEIQIAIQVSYSIDDALTFEREVNALCRFLKANTEYCGIILTNDTELMVERDGLKIRVLPTWKWLLEM